MIYDYSENILVQESAGNLLRDELAGMFSSLIILKCWVRMALSVEKATKIFCLFAILKRRFGQNCLSATMRLASLCIVSRYMSMYILDTEQLLNKDGEVK